MKRIRYKEAGIFAIVLLLLAWASYLLDSVHGRWAENHARTEVADQLSQRGISIGNALSDKFAVLYGVKSFIESKGGADLSAQEFEHLAAALRGNSAAVRAVQLVHGDDVMYVHPQQGSGNLYGLDPFGDTQAADAVSARGAYRGDVVTVSGPITQKSEPWMIARIPIRHGDRIRGSAAIIIDLSELFAEAGFTQRDGDLMFASMNEDGGVFFGTDQAFAASPVVQRLPLFDGHWDLAAAPTGGWLQVVADQVLAFRLALAVIMLLLVTVFVVSTRSRQLLRRMVERRTTELESLNAELRHEIDARRRTEADLISARDKAEHSDRLKDAFIATMSHEIRTPLHVILGYVDLLHSSKEIDDEQAMYRQSMKNAGRRLMRSVEELLHISSLRAGTFTVNPEDFDIVEAAREITRQFHSDAKERGISLVFKSTLTNATVYADRYSLEQAMQNLIDNAIKYTEVGEVEIFVRGEGNDCTLVVRDTGIGISDDYIRHVFDVFSQEKTGYSRPYDGLGLGLSLTRQFVELNNGRIDVRSQKGQGSEFTIALPTVMPVEHGVAEEIRTDTVVEKRGPSLTLIQTVSRVA